MEERAVDLHNWWLDVVTRISDYGSVFDHLMYSAYGEAERLPDVCATTVLWTLSSASVFYME